MADGDKRNERSAEGFARIAGCRLALLAQLGASPELVIAGRRYRLELERVFRLEELDGPFIYYLRNAGALQRRLARLAADGDPRRHTISAIRRLPCPDN